VPDSLGLLEFPKVATHLAGLTGTAPGRVLALALRPLADPETIALALAEAAEAMQILAELGPLPVGDGDDLTPLLERLHAEGMMLAAADFMVVRTAAEAAAACRSALGSSTWPLLQARAAALMPQPQLVAAIRRSIGARGRFSTVRSATLGQLRREAQLVRARIKRQLEGLLADERSPGSSRSS